ncbi:hypothetical protein LCGC14_2240140, partial [marine sediment metagenome]
MHAHGVDILDGADDDDVVFQVPHHLQLELLPAEHRLLDEDPAEGARVQAPLDVGGELILVV